MNLMQALVGLTSDLLGDQLGSKVETKAAKTQAKVAEAEVEVMKVAATHEAGWKKIMAQGSQNSFKE